MYILKVKGIDLYFAEFTVYGFYTTVYDNYKIYKTLVGVEKALKILLKRSDSNWIVAEIKNGFIYSKED